MAKKTSLSDGSTMGAILHGRFELDGDTATAFDQLVEDLVTGLQQQGLTFTPGLNGQIAADADKVARVVTWRPGENIELAWSGSDSLDPPPTIEVSFRTTAAGSEVVFE